jgi:Phage integrase, N-terminal SAM-like domain
MAWVEKVPRRNGYAWRVGYRGPDHRQRYKTFARKVDADRFAATVTADQARGDWTDPRGGDTNLAEWARYVESTRLNRRPSTAARDDTYLRNLILPYFGDARLGNVTPAAVQEWVADLVAAGYAPATIRKAFEILGRAFSAAVESRLIVRSPTSGTQLPKVEQSDKRFLAPAEIQHLANTI